MQLLVVLAVAVYLLGLALMIQGLMVKLLFLAVGVGGVAVAFAVTFATIIDKPDSTKPDAERHASQAAEAYAEGRFQMTVGRYDAAIKAFETAVAERDDFARGHADLASAYSVRGAATSVYSSGGSLEDVTIAITERMRAIELGDDSFSERTNLGFDSLQASLQTSEDDERDRLLRQSISETNRAISLLPDQPVPLFNLALARLLEGDIEDADAWYARAIDLTAHRLDKASLLAASLNDLEVVRADRSDLETAIDERQACWFERLPAIRHRQVS